MLISAWFLSDREINRKQILSVWFQTFVYYLLFNVIGMAVNHSFTKTGLLRSFFPLLFSNYWYSRCYIILLFCFPFLIKGETGNYAVRNAGSESYSKRRIKK